MIYVVHNIGHRLLGKVGNGMHCSQFHLFVDGGGVNVERTTEDIGETYYIIYLVGIVRASC